MAHVSVEVSGDGGDGGVRITGGESALFPRAGIRIHGDPNDSRVLPRTSIKEDFEDDSFNVNITYPYLPGWARASDQKHSGGWSLKSGVIPTDDYTIAQVAVPSGATSVSFWYRVSSVPGNKFWAVDQPGNHIQIEASGEVGWTYATLDVTGWTHVQFWYVKDATSTGGSDAAWIDDLTFQGAFGNVPSVAVHGGRAYGPVKAEMGELSDGDYGIAVVNNEGQLVKLQDFIFGPQKATKNTVGTTSSTAYTNLDDGEGPTLPGVSIGDLGRAVVTLTAYIEPPAGNQSFMGVEIRNADTNAVVRAPNDLDSLSLGGGDKTLLIGPAGRASVEVFIEGLARGRYNFIAKYRNLSAGSSLFANRVIKVQPY